MAKLAILRIRGQVGMNPKRKTALELLGLIKKFSAKIVDDTPTIKGQLKLIEPDITWGEINEEVTNTLTKKFAGKKVYHLKPPNNGFERKGIKLSYRKKGAYGYRGQAINDLLKRMM